MKPNLFKQLTLTGMLVLSLAACQKNSDSSKSDNSPAPTDASQTKPVSNAEALKNAEAGLLAVGLKFNEPAPLEDAAEIHLIKASFDRKVYRDFLKSVEVKPTDAVTVEAMKIYLAAAEKYMQEDLALNPETQENESVEDIAKLTERAVLQSRIDLVQARVEKLEKRMGQTQQGQNQQGQQQQGQQQQEQEETVPQLPEE
ncbi:MAG: hypothetical protein ACAH59_09610 [Pseudobdellovibrionaceae bacterium]